MKRLGEVALVLLLIIAAVLFVEHGPPRFWGDFTGMTEADVIERLGQPFRDSRQTPEGNPEEYTLGWHQGFQQGFFLKFKKGVVVSQERHTR